MLLHERAEVAHTQVTVLLEIETQGLSYSHIAVVVVQSFLWDADYISGLLQGTVLPALC